MLRRIESKPLVDAEYDKHIADCEETHEASVWCFCEPELVEVDFWTFDRTFKHRNRYQLCQ